MRENIVPILESFGVDVVLGGHSHIYERSFLLHGHYGYSDSLLPSMIKDAGSGRADEEGGYIKDFAEVEGREGTVYVVAGSSGHATFRTGYHPVMHASLLEMGSLVIDVSSNRLDATFLRLDGVVRDEFTIIKGVAEPEFKVVTFRVTGTIITGSWRSVPGVTYQLEKTLQLENPLWESLGAPIEAAGVTTSWTNTVDATTGFLRVRKVQ